MKMSYLFIYLDKANNYMILVTCIKKNISLY